MNHRNGYYILPNAQTTLCSLERWTHTTCERATEEGEAHVVRYVYRQVVEPECIVTGSPFEEYSISDAEVDVSVLLESEAPLPISASSDWYVKAEVLERVLKLSVMEHVWPASQCLTILSERMSTFSVTRVRSCSLHGRQAGSPRWLT